MRKTWHRYRETNYEVCRSGKVRNRKNQAILTFRHMKDGYIKVHLHCSGKDFYPRVHRIVAEIFVPNPEGKSEVDHINGRRHDNRACNLRWVTRAENQKAIKERKNTKNGKS